MARQESPEKGGAIVEDPEQINRGASGGEEGGVGAVRVLLAPATVADGSLVRVAVRFVALSRCLKR
jgi:hypothetical protein